MPVAVSLPTRIRVDRRALDERPDWIDAALSAALGRAIDNSRKVVLDPRGGYLEVVGPSPGFSWRGLPVEPDQRAAFERRIAALYASLLAERGIGDRPDAPEVIPQNPSETYDPERAHRIGGVYLVDSYAGGVEPVVVTFEPLIVGEVDVVRVVQTAADPYVLQELASISAGATPQQPLGVIYRVAHGGTQRWQALVTAGPNRLDGEFAFDAFTTTSYAGPKANPMFVKKAHIPSPGDATAKIVDLPSDRAGIKAKYREIIKDQYARMIRQAPKPVQMTTDAFRKVADAGLDQLIEDEVAKAPQDASKAVLVHMSGSEVLLWASPKHDPQLKWQGTARLTALTETRARPKSEKKSGKGGSAGGTPDGKTVGGRPGGTGLCPKDDRPDDHPPDDLYGSLEDLPFLGEPSLDEIGDAGVTLGAKISALAKRLNIPECKYAGQFCYHAASELLKQARFTHFMDETATGDNAAKAGVKGNLGVVDFTPDKSAIIEQIRMLAAVVPDLSELMRWVEAVYESQTYRCSIHGFWRGQPMSWTLRFLGEVAPVIKEAVGLMFIGACRSSLLQLLATSLIEIEKRQKAMSRYAPLFERWIVPMIAEMAELEIMRRLLRAAKMEKYTGPAMVMVGAASGQAWIAASSGLVATLKGGITRQEGMPYQVVEDGGIDKIRDRKGVLWSSEELEQAIQLNGQVAEGADPLVKQIVDTPDAIKRFKNSASIRSELESLLADMVENNNEMRQKATDDPTFALKASRISEDIPTATVSGGKYALQGIHKVAHDQIGDAFRNTGFYAAGLDDLFDSEEGKAALKGAAIMIGFVALCVLVPGGGFIAFAAGGAMAAHELSAAYEKKRLYRSLINPDLVLTSAEVELALFLGWFGVVMSAIPEAGTAAKAMIAGGKAIAKGEAKMLGKMAAKSIATRVSKELAEYAVKDLLEAFVKETVVNIVMDQVIQQVMAPLIGRIEHDASIGFGNAGTAIDTEPSDDGGEQAFIDMLLDFEETGE